MGFFSRMFKWSDEDRSTLPPKAADTATPSDLGLDAQTAAAVLAELDIDTAMAAHENWKARLLAHIRNESSEKLDPDLICQDDRCDLGRWLHGPGRERLGKYPAFSVLVARHKYFHVQASTVAAQILAGQREEAEKTLNGSFRYASNQVTLLLKELKRGLGAG